MNLRRLGPSLVLWLFPVVVIALVAAVGWGIIAASTHLFDSAGTRNLLTRLLLLPLLAALFLGVRAVLNRKPEPARGVEVTQAEHPALWAEVAKLAELAQTAPPVRIVVIPDVNAAVTEAAGQRELIIGHPLLATLTIGELRAVLAHELGHFAGGDTAASAKIARRVTFMAHVTERAGVLWRWFFRLYTRLYALVAAPVAREAERRADELSLLAAGRAAAEAHRAVKRASVAQDALFDHWVPRFDLAGRRASLGEAMRRIIAANRAAVDTAVEERLAMEQTSRYDTHPPTRERIAFFEAAPVRPESDDDTTPALALLGGGSAWLDHAEGIFLTLDLPLASWDEVMNRAAERSLDDAASRIAKVMPELGFGDGSLDSVLALIDQGDVIEKMASEDGPEAFGETVGMLCDVILNALFAVGKARVEHHWTGSTQIIPIDDSGIMTSQRVIEAIEAGSSAGLRSWLAGLGVDVATARPSGNIAAEWLAAISHIEGPWEGRRDVHFWSDGIVAMPPLSEETVRQNKDQFRDKHQHDRLYGLAERGAAFARELKGSLSWDAATIAGGEISGRFTLKMHIDFVDGSVLDMRSTAESALVPSGEDVGAAFAQLTAKE